MGRVWPDGPPRFEPWVKPRWHWRRGQFYRAQCQCGWQGRERRAQATARDDATAHGATAHRYSSPGV